MALISESFLFRCFNLGVQCQCWKQNSIACFDNNYLRLKIINFHLIFIVTNLVILKVNSTVNKDSPHLYPVVFKRAMKY